MEKTTQTLQDKPFQKVGSAIQFEKGNDQENFRCMIHKENLIRCPAQIFKNRERTNGYEVYQLALVALKKPTPEATHVIAGSLDPSRTIDDLAAEIKVLIEKDKLIATPADSNGMIPLTVAFNHPGLRPDFTVSDFRVFATGMHVPPEAYFGYADYVFQKHEHRPECILERRIEREFIGSGFIVPNEQFPGGQSLKITAGKERILESVGNDQTHFYIHLIPVQNNPQQMAACVSNGPNDMAAQYTLLMDTSKIRSMTPAQDGTLKLTCFFDDQLENKNFNIRVIEKLPTESADQNRGVSREIGIGADKEHIHRWPPVKNHTEELQGFIQKNPVIPSVDDIKKAKKSNLNL